MTKTYYQGDNISLIVDTTCTLGVLEDYEIEAVIYWGTGTKKLSASTTPTYNQIEIRLISPTQWCFDITSKQSEFLNVADYHIQTKYTHKPSGVSTMLLAPNAFKIISQIR